jgi:hypothetical protein
MLTGTRCDLKSIDVQVPEHSFRCLAGVIRPFPFDAFWEKTDRKVLLFSFLREPGIECAFPVSRNPSLGRGIHPQEQVDVAGTGR